MYTFATDKLSILKIWQNSWQLYKKIFAKIWYLFVIEFGVILLLQIPAFIEKSDVTQVNSMADNFKNIASILAILINLFIFSTVLHRIRSVVVDNTTKLTASIKTVWKKYFSIIVSLLMVMVVGFAVITLLFFAYDIIKPLFSNFSYYSTPILIAIAAIALVIFAFFGTLFAFFIPIILFEGKKYTAIFTSSKLVWNNWWRTFIVISVPGILISLLIFATCVTLAILVKNPIFTIAIFGLFTAYGILLLKPFLSSLMLVQYNDLLLRKGANNLASLQDID